MDEDSYDMPPEVARQLRAYGALDNPTRLRAYRIIHDNPEVSFNELSRRLGVATGLAAYHVGILKAAGLVDVAYARSGVATSRYALTGWGQEIFENLFGRKGRSPKVARKTRSKVLA